MGAEGAKLLAAALPKLKNLTELNLSNDTCGNNVSCFMELIYLCDYALFAKRSIITYEYALSAKAELFTISLLSCVTAVGNANLSCMRWGDGHKWLS